MDLGREGPSLILASQQTAAVGEARKSQEKATLHTMHTQVELLRDQNAQVLQSVSGSHEQPSSVEVAPQLSPLGATTATTGAEVVSPAVLPLTEQFLLSVGSSLSRSTPTRLPAPPTAAGVVPSVQRSHALEAVPRPKTVGPEPPVLTSTVRKPYTGHFGVSHLNSASLSFARPEPISTQGLSPMRRQLFTPPSLRTQALEARSRDDIGAFLDEPAVAAPTLEGDSSRFTCTITDTSVQEYLAQLSARRKDR